MTRNDIRCWCGQPADLQPVHLNPVYNIPQFTIACHGGEHETRIAFAVGFGEDIEMSAVLAAWNPPEPPEPEPEIRPCPFCGSGDIEARSTADSVTHSLRCVEYGCGRSHAMSTRSLGDAVEHWNARATIRDVEGPKMVRCWVCRGSGGIKRPLSSRRLGDCPKCGGKGEVPA